MRSQLILPTIFVCILHAACTKQKEELAISYFKPPRIVEAGTYSVAVERTIPPKVIPVTGLRRLRAGKPETVYLKSNVFPAIPTEVLPAGIPALFIPNGEGFKLPKVVHAIDSPFIAGTPDVILVNNPKIKENNPESFSSIQTKHGLQSNEISSLYEDRAGNLWIGIWRGGVSKYDGRYLTNYSVEQGLNSDVVNCIFEDDKGNIWIGTDAGVNKFDGTFITHYTTKDGLGANVVVTIAQDKSGNMWFATGNGLSRYNGTSFTHYSTAQGLSDEGVSGVYVDSKGKLWAGANGGLTMFNGHSFQNYTTVLSVNEKAEVKAKVVTVILGIVEDNDGNIWFSTNNKGAFKFDGQFVSHYTTEGGLSASGITRIRKDRNGNIWIGTWNHGANMYNGKSFIHFGSEQGLENQIVTDILQDSRGNFWIGTLAGVNKYDGKQFSQVAPFRVSDVGSMLSDNRGNIWFGSGAINKYDGKSISRYTTREGLTSPSTNHIAKDRYGNIWFGSGAGIDKFDGKYFTNYSVRNGLISPLVYCTMEDKGGNLWFGTDQGLSKLDGNTFTNYSTEQGLKDAYIYSLLEDDQGTIWIGTAKGICSFDGKTFTYYDPSYGVTHPMVVGMIKDKNNNIWFCTSKGVNKFDGKYFTSYTTEQGLSSNMVRNVFEDKDGNIWIGTVNGMNLLRREAIASGVSENKTASIFKKYTVSEGFLGGGTFPNSITQDSSGNIWIGSDDRVAIYHPEGDVPDTIPPTIQLTGISLFDETINWRDVKNKKDSATLTDGSRFEDIEFSSLSSWYNQPENLQLNYDDNYLSFHFVGITTYRPKEVRYQYFLDGFEDHWNNIADQPVAIYNNLPHGQYTFRVKAVNSEGYWSEELNYSFVILPPWWRTWWAYMLYTVSAGVMIWMFSWYRSRQLKAENIRLEENVNKRTIELERSLGEKYQLMEKVERQEALLKERMRISRELHDDIGSTLGSISIYSEVAKKRSAKNQSTDEVLLKIGHASRELIDKMSDIVWSLNPNNESFEQLQNRMVAFAAMILASRNILFDFTAEEKLKGIQFTEEQRKNIFLIFKEALHNTVKYADCKTAWITLSLDNNVLKMVIKDDGKGFEPSQINTNGTSAAESLGGNGIKNMHARADDLNANLLILSKRNEGTTIHLTLPL